MEPDWETFINPSGLRVGDGLFILFSESGGEVTVGTDATFRPSIGLSTLGRGRRSLPGVWNQDLPYLIVGRAPGCPSCMRDALQRDRNITQRTEAPPRCGIPPRMVFWACSHRESRLLPLRSIYVVSDNPVAHLDDLGHLPAEQIRLLVKVARLYHERGVRQPEIAERLHMSQPRVSRLLKVAADVGIVRTTVIAPRGVYAELEEQLEQRYGLAEVVIADTGDLSDEVEVIRALGSAAASYLEVTLTGGERIGVSSWSSSLLATVDAMRPRATSVASQVVQVLGGVGTVTAQSQATRITGRLAQLTRAEAIYLPAPGLLASASVRQGLITDPNISAVLEAWQHLTMALVGIGSLEPSKLLQQSGNAVAIEEQEKLRSAGAVGDICLRFFDATGRPVGGNLDNRVLGITAKTLRSVPRRVGVAGGARKFGAIRAALAGGWLSVFDHRFADRPAPGGGGRRPGHLEDHRPHSQPSPIGG